MINSVQFKNIFFFVYCFILCVYMSQTLYFLFTHRRVYTLPSIHNITAMYTHPGFTHCLVHKAVHKSPARTPHPPRASAERDQDVPSRSRGQGLEPRSTYLSRPCSRLPRPHTTGVHTPPAPVYTRDQLQEGSSNYCTLLCLRSAKERLSSALFF